MESNTPLNLVVEIGNTRTKMAVFDQSKNLLEYKIVQSPVITKVEDLIPQRIRENLKEIQITPVNKISREF